MNGFHRGCLVAAGTAVVVAVVVFCYLCLLYTSDSYAAAGHPLVQTPTLDRIAREGVRLSRHYSQAAPCSPGRAAIYTGTYQMNNRVVANGTPLPNCLLYTSRCV